MRLKAIYILLAFSSAGFILVWASSPIITDYEIIEEKALSNQNDDDFNTMMNVLTHQRCVNCHPNYHIPKQGDDSHPHYFDMARGEDDHGFEATNCNTCHQSENNVNSGVPGAPHWALAPASMAFVR